MKAQKATSARLSLSLSLSLDARQVSSSSLVSVHHTLLITTMTGPLSQRMPSSFLLETHVHSKPP